MLVVAFFVTLFLFIDFVRCFLEKNTAVALLNKLDVKDVQSVEILVGICHSYCQTLSLWTVRSKLPNTNVLICGQKKRQFKFNQGMYWEEIPITFHNTLPHFDPISPRMTGYGQCPEQFIFHFFQDS